MKHGTIDVLLIDSMGEPFNGNATITIQPLTDGTLGPEVAIGRKAILNYGKYRLTVRASPAYPVDKLVTINQPYLPVLVPLFVAPIELPWRGNTVTGEIPTESRSRGCRWVRLISPVSEKEYADAVASSGGKFVVDNVKPGLYLIVTFGPGGICDVLRTVVADRFVQTLRLQ